MVTELETTCSVDDGLCRDDDVKQLVVTMGMLLEGWIRDECVVDAFTDDTAVIVVAVSIRLCDVSILPLRSEVDDVSTDELVINTGTSLDGMILEKGVSDTFMDAIVVYFWLCDTLGIEEAPDCRVELRVTFVVLNDEDIDEVINIVNKVELVERYTMIGSSTTYNSRK